MKLSEFGHGLTSTLCHLIWRTCGFIPIYTKSFLFFPCTWCMAHSGHPGHSDGWSGHVGSSVSENWVMLDGIQSNAQRISQVTEKLLFDRFPSLVPSCLPVYIFWYFCSDDANKRKCCCIQDTLSEKVCLMKLKWKRQKKKAEKAETHLPCATCAASSSVSGSN